MKKVDEVIGFYPREFYCFDNFSSFKVLYEGVLYSSVEEAYQALGFINSCPEVAEEIKIYSFWGWGEDRKGQNNLGKLWMKLRDEIREE